MAAVTESKYKSFMKPVKFWQKAAPKEIATVDDTESQQEIEETTQVKTNGFIPSFGLSKKKPSQQAFVETKKGEIYKLSTIDVDGMYAPPSPGLQGKRDHWIDAVDMDFYLPSSECLTTHVGEKHDFFTPSSTFVRTQPYIFPVASHMSDSSLSTVPSFIEDDGSSDILSSSNRSSAIF
ncbi:uncharacterized protein EV154DRAFT_496436 [Mucor mucedo]|uniref:Uncharacterized protein n=1 Tax=Mucor saturninus TaxID=64648 RepID=A0A8H7US59_9FUNG|nr:uncharacterized protein EV154DRAFT_496436 [Mucor mucedo]KAG2193580.1 hypothetical protein INT47_006646 [Mucor saturninus]KAI7895264.1 hypothetical protein EV154DRAFT_496436 [Mucor mucedo]